MISQKLKNKVHHFFKNRYCNTNLHHIDGNSDDKHCVLLTEMPKDAKEASIEKNNHSVNTQTFLDNNPDIYLSVKTSMHLDDHTRPNEQDATIGTTSAPGRENFQIETDSVYNGNIDNLLNPLIDSHSVLTMTVSADSKDNVPVSTSVFLNNKDITLPTNYASAEDTFKVGTVKNLINSHNTNFPNSDSNVIVEELKNWNLLGSETYELSLKNVNTSVTSVKNTHLIIFAENSFLYDNDGTLAISLESLNSNVSVTIISYFTQEFYFMLYNSMLNKSGVKINGEGSRLKSLGHKSNLLRTSIQNNNGAVERFNGLSNNKLNIVVILSVLVILCLVFILLN